MLLTGCTQYFSTVLNQKDICAASKKSYLKQYIAKKKPEWKNWLGLLTRSFLCKEIIGWAFDSCFCFKSGKREKRHPSNPGYFIAKERRRRRSNLGIFSHSSTKLPETASVWKVHSFQCLILFSFSSLRPAPRSLLLFLMPRKKALNEFPLFYLCKLRMKMKCTRMQCKKDNIGWGNICKLPCWMLVIFWHACGKIHANIPKSLQKCIT